MIAQPDTATDGTQRVVTSQDEPSSNAYKSSTIRTSQPSLLWLVEDQLSINELTILRAFTKEPSDAIAFLIKIAGCWLESCSSQKHYSACYYLVSTTGSTTITACNKAISYLHILPFEVPNFSTRLDEVCYYCYYYYLIQPP